MPQDLHGKLKDSIRLIPHFEKCKLCLNEELAIIDDADKNLQSKRSELISQCCHRNKVKLMNLTSRKTPQDVI